MAAAVAIDVAYYNFCWMHASLTGTPVMAAKVTPLALSLPAGV